MAGERRRRVGERERNAFTTTGGKVSQGRHLTVQQHFAEIPRSTQLSENPINSKGKRISMLWLENRPHTILGFPTGFPLRRRGILTTKTSS
ncbi:unnamed protein product [Linum trigynum]|uniref:Uncharacterized protein n=1 Tax=Linum trigynum TaxID=586398 RepID=A0AAV2F474_9ROSI